MSLSGLGACLCVCGGLAYHLATAASMCVCALEVCESGGE